MKLFSKDERVYMRRCFGYMLPYKGRLIVGITAGVLGGAFNAVMLFVLKAVIDFALTGSVESPGGDKTAFLDRFFPDSNAEIGIWGIVAVCSVIPIMVGIRGFFAYLNSYSMMWVGTKACEDIRSEAYKRLLHQPMGFFAMAKGGSLIQVVFFQSQILAQAGTILITVFVKHPVSIIAIVFALLQMDWVFTLCALVVFPLCMLPVIYFGNKVRSSGLAEQEGAGDLFVRLQETIGGIRLVKSYAREEYELNRFKKDSGTLSEMIISWMRSVEMIGPLVETVASLGIAAGLVYAWLTDMPANDFWFRYVALVAIYPHVKALSKVQLELKRFTMAAQGVFAILDTEPWIKNPDEPKSLEGVKGNVEMDDVTFFYPGTEVSAVEHFTFNFEPGKRYALVGESGAGKSSLFTLLLRFYDPQAGILRLDGIDLRDVSQQDLRSQISYVSQENVLFHDTIENNILYGKLDASREEVEEAARKAFAHDFILAQPEKYDTQVGDKGAKLSGGQQQRVSIARAFLKDAPVLLLDEATSALDSESEQKVKVALDKLSEGKTVIAIAHRLFTVLNSDCILYMENGRLASYGSHGTLLESSPGYQRIVEMQFNQEHGDFGK